jgi:hypothetical protein
MTFRTLIAVSLGVAVIALTGCAPSSHQQEADELGDRLRDLPGVAQVRVDYVEPEMLDAADVNLEVVMNEEASPEEVAAVFGVTYTGLTDAHADEEGNLTVRYTGDELELRTFESEAGAADVEEAALAGAEVAIVHERVYVHLMTQEVTDSPHVESLALVRLPAGTPDKERDRVRDEVAATFGDLSVKVDIRVRHR